MRNNKGQSLVETVIVLPLILFILFAIISVGFYIYDMTVFTVASNKGLDIRLGAMGNPSIDDKDGLAENRTKGFAGVAIFVDNIEVRSSDHPDSNTITVSVEGDFKCILPFVNELLKDNFHLKSESTYVYEEPT